MPLVVKDRVRETSTSTGTGDIILNGAVQAFQDFSVIGDGNTTYYTIVDATTGAFEVGIGTYTLATTTLSRDTVLESSAGGAAVNFAANVKDVFVTYPAERSVFVDGSAISPATAARLGFANLTQGSGLSVLGVTGSTTADVASIAAGTDHQVMRRSGSALAFGPVALNQANAVVGTLPVAQGGTGVTTSTGTDNVVLSTSPTLVTPALGTPASGVLTNATGLPIVAGTTGTLSVARGGTGSTTAAFSGANITNLNASNVTSGTLNNARTTGAVANTANALVLRDASGNFNAGTVTAALSGNATTATTLQTARTIGGVSFNGSANINLPGVNVGGNQNTTGSAATLTTARTIGGVSFNGSANINLPGVNTAGNQNTSGNATTATTATNATNATVTTSNTASAFKVPFANTTVSTTGNYGLLQDSTATFTYNPNTNTLVVGTVSAALSGNATTATTTTGNAATATTLQTARTIGGVSFNGSANINLPGVNQAGNQNTSGSSASTTGNAATATTLQTARTINGVSFNGSANITISAAATNVNTQLASLGVGTAASGTAGEILATNNITAFFSDDRLKTRLGGIENALEKVKSLEGFFYEPNDVAQALGYAKTREVGVSAQQVQKVLPEIVVPAPIDAAYWTVRYEKLIPLLIEAIKEVDNELQILKQKLKSN